MASLEELRDKVATIDVWEIIKEVIKEFIEEIIDLNTGQLQQGLLSTGERTSSYELVGGESEYVKFKSLLGRYDRSIFPHVNLFNEGDFYNGWKVIIADTYLKIFSDDKKATELEERYTKDIYGLTEENMQYLIESMLPTINERIKEKLNLI